MENVSDFDEAFLMQNRMLLVRRIQKDSEMSKYGNNEIV